MAARPGPQRDVPGPPAVRSAPGPRSGVAVARSRGDGRRRRVDRDLLQVLANDCLASLPPLTFFAGRRGRRVGRAHDRLPPRAQRAAAARRRRARVRHGRPARCSAPRRASASPARARSCPSTNRSSARPPTPSGSCSGSRRASGSARAPTVSELPPALLSRHDRHVLKSGFRSILRLLEFTGNSAWFADADRRSRVRRPLSRGASTRPGPTTRRSIACGSSCSIPRRPDSIRGPIASSRSAPSRSAGARSCSRIPSTRC